MSFADKWDSISDPKKNNDNNDNKPSEGISVINVIKSGEVENEKSAPWGTHTPLVQWFLSVKATLPTQRFTLWQGEYGSVIWATPAASYESLAREIEKGPAGPYAEEVRSILEQLYTKFGKEHRP